MTDEDFICLLEERGADIAGWPAPLGKQAAMLLDHSAKARAHLRAMQDVEGFLALSRPAPSLDTTAIAARASRQNQAAPPIFSPGLRKISFVIFFCGGGPPLRKPRSASPNSHLPDTIASFPQGICGRRARLA